LLSAFLYEYTILNYASVFTFFVYNYITMYYTFFKLDRYALRNRENYF